MRRAYPISSVLIDPEESLRVATKFHGHEPAPSRISKSDEFQREQLLYYLFLDRRLIAGSMPFDDRAFETFKRKYTFICFFDDPLHLFVSSFIDLPKCTDCDKGFDYLFERYMNEPHALELGSSYARLLAGKPASEDSGAKPDVQAAKRNLDRMHVTGVTVNVDLFAARLRQTLGIRLRVPAPLFSSIEVDNILDGLGKRVRTRLESFCTVNVEIYEHARRKLVDNQ